ncbi:S8 family serine peptidase [Bacillus sp. SCS-151]|uniref:S8 family serine peptidase n=1 Tax=Nanhaiella sioensis TaxID=3115293 RepID=UPI003977FCDE
MRVFRQMNLLFLLILLITLNLTYQHDEFKAANQVITYPDRPPIPKFVPNKQEKAIIVVEEEHFERAKKQLSNSLPSIRVHQIYEIAFKGFAVEGKSQDIHKLLQKSWVKHSSSVSTYRVTLEKSVPFIGGHEVRGLFDPENVRLTGKGMRVGVIDTGVDYTHPDLQKNYGGGFDVIDDDNDPMETIAAEGLPTLHGTHVAGIIAANGKVKGVAPEAEIIAYRALGPGGVGTSDQVIAAIEKAIEDQVDVINLSLGTTVNGPDWPTSLALDKAVEQGIIAVTSSGNSGPSIWTVGSPGTSLKSISVGASTPPMHNPFIKVAFHDEEIELSTMQGSRAWDINKPTSFVLGGLGTKEDLVDVKEKIVLIERGKITFTEKALNAQEEGAVGVIIYNHKEGDFLGTLEEQPTIPVVSMSQKEGIWLKARHDEGKRLLYTSQRPSKDVLADFSSRGPVTYTWGIKPDIVAPGVAIDSTVPNGYLQLQGTSMAAPHVAGACALIKQAHPDWTPEQVKAALMNTAKTLTKEDGSLYEPYEQGAGRIQLAEAIRASTLVYPSSVAFGQFQTQDVRQKKKVTLTIENQSTKRAYYAFEYPKHQAGLQWGLPMSFTLQPKEKKQVDVKFDITPNMFEGGLHTGAFVIRENNKRITLPYLFVVDEPDYPRVIGFEFTIGDEPATYQYELYLPGGAEELAIALYDPDTFHFITYLDWQKDVERGLFEKTLSFDEVPAEGVYKAIIFAKKEGREDSFETMVVIEDIADNEK